MGYEFIRVERAGPVTTVTLNRPEVLNALHTPANVELAAAFDAFHADASQWVAIVTGAGDRAFSAGNDLKHQAGGDAVKLPPSGFGGLTSRFDLTKPVIAAVNGVAMGGGFEIALACDVILASSSARFALPEPKVGLAALGGGLHRLPRAIGFQRAMSIILTARHVTAEEGRELGFVAEILPLSELMVAARRWADQICQLSPMSIRASKEAVVRGLAAASLEQAIAEQMRYPAVRALFASEDFNEGPRAFAERRAPNWGAG